MSDANVPAKHFKLTPAQERLRRRQLKRATQQRWYWRDEDIPDTGPRCRVCDLLEPHECLDGVELVRT